MLVQGAQVDGPALTPKDRAVSGKTLVLALEKGRLLAPFVQVKLCQPEIALLPGRPVESHPPELDALVTRKASALSRSKSRVKTVGQPRGHVEESFLAGRLVVRHRRLEQVTGAEILVEEGQVPEAQVGLLDQDMSIQVTVRLLGGGDPGNQVIYLLLQRRIRMRPEHVRGAFDPLIHVRVRPPWAGKGSRGLPRRNVEITNAA